MEVWKGTLPDSFLHTSIRKGPPLIRLAWLLYQISNWNGIVNLVFFVRSMENSICPLCQGKLKVIGSRKRRVIAEDGEQITLIVRRLRCRNELCRRIHHELPDIVIPFKRHTTDTYEKVIVGVEDFAPAEESTIRRIRKWFMESADALSGGLLGTYVMVTKDFEVGLSTLPQSMLERICFFVGKDPGWLKKVVRILVNNNKWVHTRLEWLSREPSFKLMS